VTNLLVLAQPAVWSIRNRDVVDALPA
jgi:hypothetical protein